MLPHSVDSPLISNLTIFTLHENFRDGAVPCIELFVPWEFVLSGLLRKKTMFVYLYTRACDSSGIVS